MRQHFSRQWRVAGLAIAALAASHNALPPAQEGSGIERPFAGAVERVLVTGTGHWRGEGLALVEAINRGQS